MDNHCRVVGAVVLVLIVCVGYWSEMQFNVSRHVMKRLGGVGFGGTNRGWSQNATCTLNKEVCQYGQIIADRKYAIFTSSLFDGVTSLNYGFGLPLSALAWHRIGYDSLVMLIGDPLVCDNDTKIHVLMETLTNMDYVVVLVLSGIPQSQSATVSQVSRLFAASLVQDGGDLVTWGNTYLVTADADIWPIAADFFDLPDAKYIVHGDIGFINVRGVKVVHAPLSYIGMKSKTWINVMTQSGKYDLPGTPQEVIKYLMREFGSSCCDNVRHGGPGWGMDQQIVSLRIHEWKMTQNRTELIYVYKRNFGMDRFDRIRWENMANLKGIVDSHILKHGYRPTVWRRLKPLLELLHPDRTTMSWCNQYAESFYKKNEAC